jgi:hypothetical protein
LKKQPLSNEIVEDKNVFEGRKYLSSLALFLKSVKEYFGSHSNEWK